MASTTYIYIHEPDGEDLAVLGLPYDRLCPTCGGPGYELGGLGRVVWYRCQACGVDFVHDSRRDQ